MRRLAISLFVLAVTIFTVFVSVTHFAFATPKRVVPQEVQRPYTAPSHASAFKTPGHLHLFRIKPKGKQTPQTSRGYGDLYYWGGSVMHTQSITYSIFWQPSGTYMSSSYKSLIDRYFGDVGGSGLYNNNTQYYDNYYIANKSTFGGTWTDTSAYPSGSLSDAQVQSEVTKAMNAKGWTGGTTHIFFVFTAKGENICDGSSCSFSSFCAYHSNYGNNVLYAAMPYTGTNLSACGVPSSPNGDIDADSTINVTSHEHMETVTDPFGNAWYDYDGYEIGDKCAWIFGGTVYLNSHPYLVQEEYDDNVSNCVTHGP